MNATSQKEMDELRAAAHARILTAENEAEYWKKFAKRLSDALLAVRPLGGSELFIRVRDEYFADPDYCKREIEDLRKNLHDTLVKLHRR